MKIVCPSSEPLFWYFAKCFSVDFGGGFSEEAQSAVCPNMAEYPKRSHRNQSLILGTYSEYKSASGNTDFGLFRRHVSFVSDGKGGRRRAAIRALET
jgi:hypothetical protein